MHDCCTVFEELHGRNYFAKSQRALYGAVSVALAILSRKVGVGMLTSVAVQVEFVLLYRTDLGVWYRRPDWTKGRQLFLETAAFRSADLPRCQHRR